MVSMLMKKSVIFFLLFIIICCMAGVYGFLHDQISYAISPEYFTHLKFDQFNIPESLQNRLGAGIVGIMATWWMGIVIGIIVIPVGLIIPGWKNYLMVMVQTFIIMAFFTGPLFAFFRNKILLWGKDLNIITWGKT